MKFLARKPVPAVPEQEGEVVAPPVAVAVVKGVQYPKDVPPPPAPVLKEMTYEIAYEYMKKPEMASIENLLDVYGFCINQVKKTAVNPILAMRDKAMQMLMEKVAAEGLEPGEDATIMGDIFMAELSACGKTSRTVSDVAGVYEVLGLDTFLKIASVTVGDVEKYLTPEQAKLVLSGGDAYTSKRKLSDPIPIPKDE